MHIREFRKEDAEETSSLIRKSLLYRNNKGYNLEQLYSICNHYSSDYLRNTSKDNNVYVAVDGLLIIGFCMLKGNEFIIYILPGHQKKGIGTEMMKFMEDKISAKGNEKIWAVAGLPALEFYKKLGYSVTGEKIHLEWGKGYFIEKQLK